MVHLHDRIADPVKEISVMGHHQKRTAGTAQISFEKLDCIYVQMVGGLVHDEELRL